MFWSSEMLIILTGFIDEEFPKYIEKLSCKIPVDKIEPKIQRQIIAKIIMDFTTKIEKTYYNPDTLQTRAKDLLLKWHNNSIENALNNID